MIDLTHAQIAGQFIKGTSSKSKLIEQSEKARHPVEKRDPQHTVNIASYSGKQKSRKQKNLFKEEKVFRCVIGHKLRKWIPFLPFRARVNGMTSHIY